MQQTMLIFESEKSDLWNAREVRAYVAYIKAHRPDLNVKVVPLSAQTHGGILDDSGELSTEDTEILYREWKRSPNYTEFKKAEHNFADWICEYKSACERLKEILSDKKILSGIKDERELLTYLKQTLEEFPPF